jgi:hypothetical protein
MMYTVDGKAVSIDISGDVVVGENRCLLDEDDNLVAGCAWQDKGFVVSPVLDEHSFELLCNGIRNLVSEALEKAGCNSPASDFDLERYHDYCPDQQTHLKVVDALRGRAWIANFPIDYRLLDEKISLICGKEVSCHVPGRIASGYFFVRLVRPYPACDNNPPHRDAWLDRLRHCINLYLPLAGSDDNSSLSVAPGSHFWSESNVPRTAPDALVNGARFSVPSAVINGDVLNMTRPPVGRGEGMIFSPYLIHGGAVNFNKTRTRVSLEMRFWRRT